MLDIVFHIAGPANKNPFWSVDALWYLRVHTEKNQKIKERFIQFLRTEFAKRDDKPDIISMHRRSNLLQLVASLPADFTDLADEIDKKYRFSDDSSIRKSATNALDRISAVKKK